MTKNYIKKSREEKQHEIKEAMETLKAGVAAVFTSENYKKALEFFSQFHNYSFNNCILIAAQAPDATQVASFAAWKKMGGKIKKGSKAIKVLCPIPYAKKVEVIKENGDVEEEIKNGITFRLGNVFDISQVEGIEAPTIAAPLKGNSEQLKKLISKIIEGSNVPIVIDPELNKKSENGYYHLKNKDIHIKESLDDTHKVKTIIHELAHSILHSELKCTRREAEVQAESVAFIVCSRMGIDTSDYSFGYIASWSSGKNIKELKSSLDLIEKTSKKIIAVIAA